MPYKDPKIRAEKAREYSRISYLKNRTKKSASDREWAKNNPDKMLAYSKAFYRRNRERILARKKADRQANNLAYRNREAESRKKNPLRVALRSIRTRANEQGVRFNLTEEWFLAHYSQGCAMTGWEFDALSVGSNKSRKYPSPLEAHVDRIKAGGDYTMDNCRMVCAAYNVAKWCWSDEDVLRLARALKENI